MTLSLSNRVIIQFCKFPSFVNAPSFFAIYKSIKKLCLAVGTIFFCALFALLRIFTFTRCYVKEVFRV